MNTYTDEQRDTRPTVGVLYRAHIDAFKSVKPQRTIARGRLKENQRVSACMCQRQRQRPCDDAS